MPDTMRAAVYYRNDDVRIEELEKPRAGAGELLVETRASGICGSDVMEWYRVGTAPRVLGHEVTGVVAEAGEGVDGFCVGDRVCVTHHVPCNRCALCLRGDHTACEMLKRTNFDPGGFAEFIRLPAINVERGAFRLPDGVSDDAGVFIEPLGCVLRGWRRFRMMPGLSVLVVGSGMSGLLHVQAAHLLGAGSVFATDISSYRLKAAERFGAHALPPCEDMAEALREANDGRLADRVVLCAGAPEALETALASVATCGVLQLFAPTPPGYRPAMDLNRIWSEQIALTTTYGAAPLDLEEALALISTGRIDAEEMITHRLPLEQAQEGFRLVAEAGESLKVVLKP
ncbi:MAG: alcohol dehydrogenase catalytic domain-containing protein [Nitrospinae bacterium]|nr:alcohol dehydrogenase catalytic domain-containing protein [Nitrospinota bacterium]